MDINEFISSGKLELYVYGALSEKESVKISGMLKQYPEIRLEVEEIEAALIKISGTVAPDNPEELLFSIKQKLSRRETLEPKVVHKSPWIQYLGWAASIVLLIGMFFLFNKNQKLEESLSASQFEQIEMENQIVEARKDTQKTKELLQVLRDKDILRIPLKGQEIAPEAFATAYWQQEQNITYIDAQALPDPPPGMTYQVWSLKLNPLAATSIGLLEEFEQDGNKIFKLANINSSEGFGITLEPEGGSKTPNLEKLYTLGTVSNS